MFPEHLRVLGAQGAHSHGAVLLVCLQQVAGAPNGGFHLASFWLWSLLCLFIPGRLCCPLDNMSNTSWALKSRSRFMFGFHVLSPILTHLWQPAGVGRTVGHGLCPLGGG